MRINVFIFIVFYSFGMGTRAEINAGILVPASPACEEIDGVMDANLKNADKETDAMSAVIREVEKASDNACLPSLQEIGSMINASVPSFSFSGILTKIKDSACSEANKAVERSLNKYKIVANAPYGLGHLKVGVGKEGDGDDIIKQNGKSVFDPLEREAIKIGGDFGKGAIDAVTTTLPNTEGVNRTIRKESSGTNRQFRESVDSAREAINGL